MTMATSDGVPAVVPAEDLPGGDFARRFDGRDHGAGISFFVVRSPPGRGPELHRHPYEETFVVLEGRATFSVGDRTVEVAAGQIVVVPAGAVHRFVGIGDEELRLVSIHSSDHVVQESIASR
jgi:mannose-6-phosphate isomerase-like protein (cupin superfamily)